MTKDRLDDRLVVWKETTKGVSSKDTNSSTQVGLTLKKGLSFDLVQNTLRNLRKRCRRLIREWSTISQVFKTTSTLEVKIIGLGKVELTKVSCVEEVLSILNGDFRFLKGIYLLVRSAEKRVEDYTPTTFIRFQNTKNSVLI